MSMGNLSATSLTVTGSQHPARYAKIAARLESQKALKNRGDNNLSMFAQHFFFGGLPVIFLHACTIMQI
jgi:hypothetical protein